MSVFIAAKLSQPVNSDKMRQICTLNDLLIHCDPDAMMKLYISGIILLLAFSPSLKGQRNNIWYFGSKAGLSFNSLPPVPLDNSVMDATEGSASICDEAGQLLFYTNGISIYNRQHQLMANGDNLKGHLSSFQGCIIIPHPAYDSIFYLFTTDAIENGFANGYNYSIIDMSLDNGMGAVTSKNVLLDANCTERMTAVRHENGVDVWLITNDPYSNVFRSWLITCNGLQPNPVISTAGEVLDRDVLNKVGMMKVSPNGSWFLQTHFSDDDPFIAHFFQLFDFDASSGIISNPRKIGYLNTKFLLGEFSPDSRLLYISKPQEGAIDQFDLSAPDIPTMVSSRFTLTNTPGYYGMQLGPDQKIYLSHPSHSLGVINNPNVQGAGCNFNRDQQPLANGGSKLGMPQFINDLSYDPSNGFTYTIIDSCAGTVQFNATSNFPPPVLFSWDFGDGNTSTQQNPIHTFNPSNQTYKVNLRIAASLFCGNRSVSRSQTVRPMGQTNEVEFSAVFRCDSGYVRFTNLSTDLSANYIWDFGDGQFSNDLHPRHTYANPGDYNVKLKLNTALVCMADSVSHKVSVNSFSVQTIPTQTILIGESVFLNVSGAGNSYLWTPGKWLSDSTIKNPVATPEQDVTYAVFVTNSDGCVAVDSVFIKVIPIDGIYMPGGFTPNNNGKNDVIRPTYSEKFTLREFSIYNRWGQRVFTTSQRSVGWNGKVNGLIQDTGVYIWVIEVVDRFDDKKFQRKGTFVLIR